MSTENEITSNLFHTQAYLEQFKTWPELLLLLCVTATGLLPTQAELARRITPEQVSLLMLLRAFQMTLDDNTETPTNQEWVFRARLLSNLEKLATDVKKEIKYAEAN